jgi:hypothetical protein
MTPPVFVRLAIILPAEAPPGVTPVSVTAPPGAETIPLLAKLPATPSVRPVSPIIEPLLLPEPRTWAVRLPVLPKVPLLLKLPAASIRSPPAAVTVPLFVTALLAVIWTFRAL